MQITVKLVIEPVFETDFRRCSFGSRPKRTPRMALTAIAVNINDGLRHVVDVDLTSYFDSIDHALLMRLVERRIGDVRVLRLIRAWLTADVLEDGVTTHPLRGTPQGGVISPVLSNIVLHEIDRLWCDTNGEPTRPTRLVRYADDMVVMARTADDAATAWQTLQGELTRLEVSVNTEKSRVTTAADGFAFLGFEFRTRRGRLYMWPRAKAVAHLAERVREVVRSIPSSAQLRIVIAALNPVLVGWCTYFRVGNSNRAFHKVDRAPNPLEYSQGTMELPRLARGHGIVPHGRKGEPPPWLAGRRLWCPRVNAAGRRWSESRVREIRTHGSMRGSRKRALTGAAPVPYSTSAPASGACWERHPHQPA